MIFNKKGEARFEVTTPFDLSVFGFFGSDVDRSCLGFYVDSSDVFTDQSECHQDQSADEEDEAEE